MKKMIQPCPVFPSSASDKHKPSRHVERQSQQYKSQAVRPSLTQIDQLTVGPKPGSNRHVAASAIAHPLRQDLRADGTELGFGGQNPTVQRLQPYHHRIHGIVLLMEPREHDRHNGQNQRRHEDMPMGWERKRTPASEQPEEPTVGLRARISPGHEKQARPASERRPSHDGSL